MKADNRVPPAWLPMSAHGDIWEDGETILGALRVNEKNGVVWEYWKLRISCDEHYFELSNADTNEPFTDWPLEDFEFYIPVQGG